MEDTGSGGRSVGVSPGPGPVSARRWRPGGHVCRGGAPSPRDPSLISRPQGERGSAAEKHPPSAARARGGGG